MPHVKSVFKQQQTKQFPLEDLTTGQFIILAIETSHHMGWVLANITECGFTAYTGNGLFSWNAEIKMEIRNGLVNLTSRSREDTLTDIMGNKKNIREFILTFSNLKSKLSLAEFPVIYEIVELNVA